MNKLASVIDINHVLNVAQRRCDDFGVTVKFDSYVNTAQTTGKDITLPMIKQPITQEQLDTLYGYIIHECGHHQRSEAFDIANAAQPPDHVFALYNIIEDEGMERERALEWKGDRIALATMNGHLMEEARVNWTNAIANLKDVDSQPPEPLAASLLGRLAALSWDNYNDISTQGFINAMPDHVKKLTGELLDEGWVEKLQGTVTPHDTWDVTIDLAKRLYPQHDEDQLEQMRQDGHDKQQGRDKNKDESLGTNPKGDESGQEVDSPNGDGDRKEDGRTISWKDVVISEHNEWEPSDMEPGGFGIDWTGKTSRGSVGLMPTNLINVIDLAKEVGPDQASQRRIRVKAESYMPSEESSRAFANRIRRYIQSQARSVVDKEKYHGRLDKGALVRLALPPIDGGEYNKRVFYDQRKHTMKDTAIFVLVDWSGSMSGDKMHYAADAAQRLVHTFDRVLNVPVALAAFSNRSTECDIGYIKKFNTRGTPATKIAERFQAFYGWTAANNDADSVNWAWHEILKRKESRKILIVLSDGCPAGSWGNTISYKNLNYITNVIEKDKRVELHGVGIQSDAVKQYYSSSRVLNNPEEINTTLFNIIKDGHNAYRRR